MPFPTPWTVHHNDDAYWVESANGRKFGYVYFRDHEIIGTSNDAYQTRDEARRLVSNFAKLPDLLGRTEPLSVATVKLPRSHRGRGP
jgi:hypothetical protein